MEPFPDLFDASGCFETVRVERGKPVHLKEHLRRLGSSLKTLGIPVPEDRALRGRVEAEARSVKSGNVRLCVRRNGDILLHGSAGGRHTLRKLSEGISLVTAAAKWPAGEPGLAQVKLSERLPGILARLEAPEAPEVLRIGAQGYLTEGTVSNFFFVKGGVLFTPPAWAGVLEGVTRAEVLRAAARLKIPVRQLPATRHDAFNADEAFITNVLMKIVPVRELDGRRIGSRVPGPVTRRLSQLLRKEGKN